MPDEPESFCVRLQSLRTAKGLSQREISEIDGLGHYWELELGRKSPTGKHKILLADLFQVTVCYLMTGVDGDYLIDAEMKGREMFGERLKRLRNKKGLTASSFGDQIGVSGTGVYRWETGENKPTPENIVKIASILSVSTDYLLTGREHSKHAALIAAVRAAGTRDPRLMALIEQS